VSGPARDLPPDIDPAWPAPDLSVSARFDFPAATAARRMVIVGSTPRSGSTLLCRALWLSGAVGAPCEYFGYEYSMVQMMVRLRVGSMRDYVERLLALRTGPNGVFGCKMHWDSFQFTVQAGLLPTLPPQSFVLVEREDRVAQAVSFARAAQTNQWAAGQPAMGQPRYDGTLIGALLKRTEHQIKAWRDTLRQNRRDYLAVTYEQLVRDPGGTVDGVLQRLGLARDPAFRMDLPPLLPQRDALSRDWAERFRRENPGT
jgi:LPS sulfotransferase NodH